MQATWLKGYLSFTKTETGFVTAIFIRSRPAWLEKHSLADTAGQYLPMRPAKRESASTCQCSNQTRKIVTKTLPKTAAAFKHGSTYTASCPVVSHEVQAAINGRKKNPRGYIYCQCRFRLPFAQSCLGTDHAAISKESIRPFSSVSKPILNFEQWQLLCLRLISRSDWSNRCNSHILNKSRCLKDSLRIRIA